MAQPFKASNGVYYIRRKVPEALRTALGREYKRSLNTRDAGEAKRLFAIEWEKSEALMALARAQQAGVAALSELDMRILAERWYDEELSKLEASGHFSGWLATGGSESWELGDIHDESMSMVTLQEALNDSPEDEALVDTAGLVKTALRNANIPVPAQGSPAFETLVALFRTQWLRLSETALSRYRGDWTPSRSALSAEALSVEVKKPVAEKSLLNAVEDYVRERLLTDGDTRAVQRTNATYRALVDEFIELYGDLPLSKINREVIRQYRHDISMLPVKGKGIRKLTARQRIAKAQAESLPTIEAGTIKNKVRGISAILGYALRMQLITENPVIAGGIGGAAAKAAARQQVGKRARNFYDEAELKRIFSSPAFVDPTWTPPRADFGKAWYWLPLLMYYTGARREELAQLMVRDFRSDAPDVDYYLSILNTEGEEDGQRGVKTDSSRRSIPIHDDLITLGLHAYVAALPQNGQMFPMLKPNPAGYYGANFGKRWAEYLRKQVGLQSTADPSHGFRHTFKTLCRKVCIEEAVHDAITGHSGGSNVARDYGEMPLSRMYEELKKYPTLEIVTYTTFTGNAP
jgi:integrase